MACPHCAVYATVSRSRASTLTAAVRIAYAGPAFALAAVGIPIYVHLPKFYTDVVGVSVGTVGLLLMASRIFDGILDPVVGYWSDRTRTRWGRRRPWIVGASAPLAAALFLLFSPPVTGAAAAWWLGTTLFAVFLLWTIVIVPYESLGPELTFDYDERTSLLALRDGALLAGTLVAAASPAIAAAALGGSGPDAEAARFRAIALVYGPVIVAACVLCAWRVRERPPRDRGPGEAAGGAFDSARAMAANRPFRILLGSYSIAALGSNLPGTLILFYVEYVLRSEHSDVFMLLYLVTGIAFLPAWVRAASRADKKTAWLAATAINTGSFFGVYFLGAGDEVLYGLLVVLSGIGFGAVVAIPSSMQADVIDYDELLTGVRREGSYLGVWSVARKAAAALGVGAGLGVLQVAGYAPNAAQTETVTHTLSALYALFPCLCNAAGFALALAYPIGRGKHQEILAAIESRRRGVEVVDPLRPSVHLGAYGARP